MMLGTSPFMMASVASSPPAPPTPDSWTQGTIGSATLTRRIKYANGRFVVTSGESGIVRVSATGSAFTNSSATAAGATTRFYAYGAGVHVLGRSGTAIYSSTDFLTWTSRTITTGTLLYIHYSDVFNMFMAVGEAGIFRYSSDGTTWSNGGTQLGGVNINKVASGNGVAVMAGRGEQAYSTNGTTWTTFSLPFAVGSDRHVTFGNGLFTIANSAGSVATSPNGITWTVRTAISTGTIDVGTFTNLSDLHADSTGVVVFVGGRTATSRGIYVTTNFTTYQAKDNPLGIGTIESVTKGGSTWVVTGANAADYLAYSTVP